MPTRPIPRHAPTTAAEASDPAENPTAARLSNGEEFIDDLGAIPTDEDGNRVAVELRDGKYLVGIFSPDTERLLRRILARLDEIANHLTARK